MNQYVQDTPHFLRIVKRNDTIHVYLFWLKAIAIHPPRKVLRYCIVGCTVRESCCPVGVRKWLQWSQRRQTLTAPRMEENFTRTRNTRKPEGGLGPRFELR